MKRPIIILLAIVLIALSACGGPTISPADVTPSPIASSEPTPNADEFTDVDVLDAYDLLWNYEHYDALELRDSILAGRSYSELSPNERHNVLMIDFRIRDYVYVYQTPMPSNFAARQINQPYMVDLNGDGVKEHVEVRQIEGGGALIMVNDLSVEYHDFDTVLDTFAVVDIDTSDQYKEIVVSDKGQYWNEYSVFYYYDGERIVLMNEDANSTLPLPPSIDPGEYSDKLGGRYTEIQCTGDGFLLCKQWASILQEWRFDLRYVLTAEHLLRAVPELYAVDAEMFILKEIQLYSKMDVKSPTITLERSTVVRLIVIDNSEWVQVMLASGKTGWFRLDENGSIAYGDEHIDPDDVFFWLNHYR